MLCELLQLPLNCWRMKETGSEEEYRCCRWSEIANYMLPSRSVWYKKRTVWVFETHTDNSKGFQIVETFIARWRLRPRRRRLYLCWCHVLFYCTTGVSFLSLYAVLAIVIMRLWTSTEHLVLYTILNLVLASFWDWNKNWYHYRWIYVNIYECFVERHPCSRLFTHTHSMQRNNDICSYTHYLSVSVSKMIHNDRNFESSSSRLLVVVECSWFDCRHQ